MNCCSSVCWIRSSMTLGMPSRLIPMSQRSVQEPGFEDVCLLTPQRRLYSLSVSLDRYNAFRWCSAVRHQCQPVVPVPQALPGWQPFSCQCRQSRGAFLRAERCAQADPLTAKNAGLQDDGSGNPQRGRGVHPLAKMDCAFTLVAGDNQ